MPFDVVGRVGPGNRVLHGRGHQCHMANTVEQLCAAAMSGSATWGGDAAYSQITFGNHLQSVLSHDATKMRPTVGSSVVCEICIMCS